MKKNFFSLFKGFSLIELLISLIIISLIAAAFAPTLTSKVKSQNISLSTTEKISSSCPKFSEECKLCKPDKCLICDKTCATDEFKDIDNCKCVKCSEKYETTCASCDINSCKGCIAEFALKNGICVDTYTRPSIINCAKINAIYIKKEYNGTGNKDICVSKYNAGDAAGPNTPDNSAPNCWRGNTAKPAGTPFPCTTVITNTSVAFNYSSCYRTVCTWSGANNICSKYHYGGNIKNDNWRLPTMNELKGWGENIAKVSKGLGSDGLQLCDVWTSAEAMSPICDLKNDACPGATYGICYPSHVWSSTSGSYYDLVRGTFVKNSGASASFANSARCVIEKFQEK